MKVWNSLQPGTLIIWGELLSRLKPAEPKVWAALCCRKYLQNEATSEPHAKDALANSMSHLTSGYHEILSTWGPSWAGGPWKSGMVWLCLDFRPLLQSVQVIVLYSQMVDNWRNAKWEEIKLQEPLNITAVVVKDFKGLLKAFGMCSYHWCSHISRTSFYSFSWK